MAGVVHCVPRSATWREREVLDLLSFWGEEKIQEALRSSHRNLDNFEKIARQMVSRGHRRTAVECRNKTKSMRLEYKRVIAHNATSGNAPMTCPYFRELDSILRGDASVRPKRIARSISIDFCRPQNDGTAMVMEGSEELFTHEYVTIDLAQVRSSSPAPMGEQNNSSSSTDTTVEDLDRTIDGLEDKENDDARANMEEDADSDSDLPLHLRNRGGAGRSNTCLAELSPGTRLSNIKNRKRRNAALYGVADQMMSRSREEHEAHLAQWHVDRELMCGWKAEEKNIQKEFLEETRKERENFSQAWKQNFEVMSDAVKTLRALGEMLAQQRQQNAVHTNDVQSAPSNTPVVSKSASARRSCVGKARDRLTL
ncbi:uncharacterized protein LOC129340925 [Eublepharis macularius]|uniref:Uncharacterized protein LOC129333947 n=1 Tax=Eublepharis macularius TaxID=481883 RepID=A0AA97JRX2_EUBMA|nr:uncharacterized protein LOC129333947 [Eublepharis macularius]XP_054844605.1 uncharacterized protein LOC129335821 [Eublepharis macularius]XP_054851796.1 uncharacterized protein LOC129340925 [Eublepharis macularius]